MLSVIDNCKNYGDLCNAIKTKDYSERKAIFIELVEFIFTFHPLYDYVNSFDIIDEGNIYTVSTKTARRYMIQIKYVNKNERITWSNNNEIHITNSMNKYNISKGICLTGHFFENLKPEFFTFMRNKLMKELYVFPKLIPSLTNTKLINSIIGSNVRKIECEFNTDIILNGHWLNKELDSRVTILITNNIQQSIRIYNDCSYQKLINNHLQHIFVVHNQMQNDSGIIILSDKKDINDAINRFCSNEDINLTIIVTSDNVKMLIGHLNTLCVVPNIVMTFNCKNWGLSAEINISLIYPVNHNPSYALSNCPMVKVESVKNESVKNEEPVKQFKKTNIMDYLDNNGSGDDNEIKNVLGDSVIVLEDCWDQKYTDLCGWTNINGRIPQSSEEPIENLHYEFVRDQLYNIQYDKLPLEKINKLEMVKGWEDVGTDRKISIRWLTNYHRLFKWITKNGYPQQCSPNNEESMLFVFLYEYLISDNIKLCKYKRQKMENLLDWDDFYDMYKEMDVWTINYYLLLGWINCNKRMPNMDETVGLEEYQMALFMEQQKINYILKQMDDNKINMLEKLNGWIWIVDIIKNDVSMDDCMYQELKTYIMVNNVMPGDDTKLGRYILSQKYYKCLHKLSDKQIYKLELLPLWDWTVNNDIKVWNILFDVFVLSNDKIFVDMQRKLYKMNLLDRWKIDKLLSLKDWTFEEGIYINNDIKPVILNQVPISKSMAWDVKYDELSTWYETHNCSPKKNMDDENEKLLNFFVDKQKNAYKSGLLNDAKIKQLEMLPGWNWITDKTALDDEWTKVYGEFVKWTDKNGRLPEFKISDETEKKMFWYCVDQKLCKLDGKMDIKRIKKLELIKNWNWATGVNVKITSKKWDDKYSMLCEWIKTKNKYPIKGTQNELEESLITFINSNKQAYTKQKLNNNQITRLEQLPNWSWELVKMVMTK